MFPKSPFPAAGQLPAHWSTADSGLLKGNTLQSGAEAARDDGRFFCLRFQKTNLVVLAGAEKEGQHVPRELLSLVFFIMLKRSENYKAESDMVGRRKVMTRNNH